MAEWWQGSHTYLIGSSRPGRQLRLGMNHLLDPVNESRGEISRSTARDVGLCSVRAPTRHRVPETPHRDLGGKLKSQTKSEQVPTADGCGSS